MVDKVSKRPLNVCQVNICNLSPNSQLALEKYIWDKDIDLLAIQETKLNVPPSLKNYYTYSSPSRGENWKEGGAAIYISKAIKNQTRLTQFESDECNIIWVLITIGSKKVIIGTAYIQPENIEHLKILLEQTERINEYARNHQLHGIGLWGDFNARNILWNDTATNKHGEHLREFIETSDFSIISPGEATFSCMSKEGKLGSSLIDLVLCTDALKNSFKCCWVDKEISLRTGAPGRGHWPVISQLDLDVDKNQRNKVTEVFDWKNTDWKVWKETLDNQIESNSLITESENPCEVWEEILKEINASKELSIPKKTISAFSKPYWNNELSIKSRRLRLANKEFNSRSTIENKLLLDELRDDLNESISLAINEWSEINSNNLNTRDKDAFWKAYRKNFKELEDNNGVDILEGKDGKLVYSPAEKIKILHNTFFTGQHLADSKFDEPFKHRVNEEVHKRIAEERLKEREESDDMNRPFDTEELEAALGKIKTANKSLDGDGIHPILVKNIGHVAKQAILRLCNLCLQTGIWVWKNSKVIFLKKPGKPSYQSASAYRPICLTSYVGKVLERLVESRYRFFMYRKNLIDPEQEGFMHGRSTTRYLYRLTSKINTSRNNKKVGLLLLIDFEKAYDSVWVEGLLKKMFAAGLTGKMWVLTADYLLTRRLNIQLGEISIRDLESLLGLPQGSILAPLLFIFYIAEMLDETCSEKYKFADDATLYSEQSTKEAAILAMQNDMNKLYDWVSKWRFKVNCQRGKTEMIAINFTPSESDSLFLGENKVEFVKESKILGVWIDGELSWKRQISETRSNSWYAWKRIKTLCNRNYGLKLATIINLVKVSVITTLFYCAPVWADKVENQFQDLWYNILKVATGASCKPSLAKLEVLCSLPPLEIQSKAIITKFLIKNFMNHEEDLLVKEITSNVNTRGHFITRQVTYVKEYVAERLGSSKGSHRLDIMVYRNTELAGYTKNTMWKFTKQQWTRHVITWSEDENYVGLLSNKSIRTPCSRSTEVYLLSLIHGRISLNKFLHKLKLVKSPLCSCGKAEEDAQHVIFQCEDFADSRKSLELETRSSVISFLDDTGNKADNQDIKNLCKLIAEIKAKKKKDGRKELKKYFEKKEKDLLTKAKKNQLSSVVDKSALLSTNKVD